MTVLVLDPAALHSSGSLTSSYHESKENSCHSAILGKILQQYDSNSMTLRRLLHCDLEPMPCQPQRTETYESQYRELLCRNACIHSLCLEIEHVEPMAPKCIAEMVDL